MTNLENTIPELQELLKLANALPEEGGSSGGTEVKTFSGSFTTNTNGSATVSCGFRPDVVVIKGFSYNSYDEEYQLSFCFPEVVNQGYTPVATAYSETYESGIFAYFTLNTSGFAVQLTYYTSSGDESNARNTSFSYTAIKYTA